MIIEKVFSWDYDLASSRAEEAEKQIAAGAICVLTDHEWSDGAFSLSVYRPVHRHEDFKGGYYEKYHTSEHYAVTESEAYALMSDYLKNGEPLSFSYDSRNRFLIVFHFRPTNPLSE